MSTPRLTKVLERERKTRVVGAAEVGGAWLVPRDGKQAGQIFPLHAVNVIGAKVDECHVVLDEEHVSSRHAEVAWRKQAWVLTDLGSTNGTFVGEMRLGQGERYEGLVDGEVLAFGTLKVTFKCV